MIPVLAPLPGIAATAGGGAPPSGPARPSVGGLVNEAGSTTIAAADLPGLEVSLDGGASWQRVADAGLAVSRTGPGTLTVTGLPGGGTVPRFRYHGDPLAEPFYEGSFPNNAAVSELWWSWPVADTAAAPGLPVWPTYTEVVAS